MWKTAFNHHNRDTDVSSVRMGALGTLPSLRTSLSSAENNKIFISLSLSDKIYRLRVTMCTIPKLPFSDALLAPIANIMHRISWNLFCGCFAPSKSTAVRVKGTNPSICIVCPIVLLHTRNARPKWKTLFCVGRVHHINWILEACGAEICKSKQMDSATITYMLCQFS